MFIPMHKSMMEFFVVFMNSVAQREMAFTTCNNVKNAVYQKCDESENENDK